MRSLAGAQIARHSAFSKPRKDYPLFGYQALSVLPALTMPQNLLEKRLPVNSRKVATVPPDNPSDLQSLKLIDFHLLRWSVQQRLFTVLGALTSMLKTSAELRLENLALRQQLAVLRRSAPKRLKLTPADRIFWVWLRRIVKAEQLSPGIVRAFACSGRGKSAAASQVGPACRKRFGI